jgi:transposase
MHNTEDFKKLSLKIPDEISSAINDLLIYAAKLETKVALLEYRKYGRSSEKFVNPHQGTLFNEPETILDQSSESGDDEQEEDLRPGSENKKGGASSKKRRRKLEIPENIERQTEIHDLSEAEKICPCCGKDMCQIGKDITEKADLIPAKLIAKQDIYLKYACKDSACDGKPKQAPRPETAIGKVMATTALMAFIAAQKYNLGVPLYRLEDLFANLGIKISRCLMSLWMIKVAEALRPIYLTLEENLLARDYIHIDETGLQVLQEPGKSATSKSYMWVRRSGESRGPPIILYDYDASRSSKVAARLLRGFKGYLQSDDYVGYTTVDNSSENITHLLCWDHSRRYFWEAYQAIPMKKRKNSASEQALKLIKKLYKLEKGIKNKTDEEILKVRTTEAREVLNKLKNLCDHHRPSLGSDTPTAKAIDYMTDNWEKLQIYLEVPFLNISNGPAERAVRPFALGRKAWLFCKTPRGAEASAILYSLVVTAKANGRDPLEYLQSALDGIALVKTADDLEALLPTSTMVN